MENPHPAILAARYLPPAQADFLRRTAFHQLRAETPFCAESRVAQKLGIVFRFLCSAVVVRTGGVVPKIPYSAHFWYRADFCHKNRFDLQFVDGLNQHADVMAEHLTESFVDLPNITLTA